MVFDPDQFRGIQLMLRFVCGGADNEMYFVLGLRNDTLET